ncbi:MAG: hypothetical protein ACRDHF_14110 [Tepidiformaceae bacterium]
MTELAPLHPTATYVLGMARVLTSDPARVEVEEVRRDREFLLLHIHPGSDDNAGAIIGTRGANIERIRLLAQEHAAVHGLTVKIKVLSGVGAR